MYLTQSNNGIKLVIVFKAKLTDKTFNTGTDVWTMKNDRNRVREVWGLGEDILERYYKSWEGCHHN